MYQPLIIGLTGNIATGKSTVLAYLRQKGAYIIDADRLSHRAMHSGGAAYAPIVAAFGPGVVRADGEIDRAALGRIVFSDPDALTRLEQIVHPAVFDLARQELAGASEPVVVIEAIKLLESRRLLTLCSEVWVITADPAVQLQRLVRDRAMSEEDARQRMTAQTPQAEKVALATRVIANNGSPDELYAQLDALWNELALDA